MSTPHPLGCRPNTDARNARYRVTRVGAPRTVRWLRNIRVTDQGDLGSCVGQAFTGAVACNPLWETLPSKVRGEIMADPKWYAEGVYSAATVIDPYEGAWPPDDTGTDTTSGARVLKDRGLIQRYEWIQPGDDSTVTAMTIVGALANGPVVIGIPWFDSFDWPDGNGVIALTSGSEIRGGHALVVDECNVSTRMIGITNSWGTGWGIKGRCWMSWETLSATLESWGDACIPVAAAPDPSTPKPIPWWKRVWDVLTGWLW